MSLHCIVGCKLPHGLRIQLGNAFYDLKGRNASRIIGGYGLTTGVPTDAFAKWLEDHKDFKYVRNGLVFMQGDMASARAQARDGNSVRSGLEPIDPMAKDITPEDAKKLAQQRAENPDRNRQIVE